MYNKVIISGRMAYKPKVRTVNDGATTVCNFAIGTTNCSYDKNNKKEGSTFLDCVAWGGNASNIEKFFDKGDAIELEGHLKQEKRKNKEGVEYNTTVVIVEKFRFPMVVLKNKVNEEFIEESANEEFTPSSDPFLPFN